MFHPFCLNLSRYLRKAATEKLLLEGDIASLAARLKISQNKSLHLATFSFKYESIAFSSLIQNSFKDFRDLAMTSKALDLKSKQCLFVKTS